MNDESDLPLLESITLGLGALCGNMITKKSNSLTMKGIVEMMVLADN